MEPMNMLTVRFMVDANYRPKGLKLARGIEGVNYHRFGKLPFLPVKGMEIDCGDGDLRTVDTVYYSCDTDELALHFVDQDEPILDHPTMVKRGWVLG
jgi:hypothetical protein